MIMMMEVVGMVMMIFNNLALEANGDDDDDDNNWLSVMMTAVSDAGDG